MTFDIKPSRETKESHLTDNILKERHKVQDQRGLRNWLPGGRTAICQGEIKIVTQQLLKCNRQIRLHHIYKPESALLDNPQCTGFPPLENTQNEQENLIIILRVARSITLRKTNNVKT